MLRPTRCNAMHYSRPKHLIGNELYLSWLQALVLQLWASCFLVGLIAAYWKEKITQSKKQTKKPQTHNTQASKKDLGVKLCFSERNVKKTI